MGHRDAWDYTPRQLGAFLFLAQKRIKRESARELSIQSMAARGEPRALKAMHKELCEE